MGLGSTAGRGAAGTGASERRALSPAAESCSGSPSGSVTWDRDWRAAEQRAFLRPGGGPGLTRRRLQSRAGVVWAGLHLQTGTRRPCLSGQTTPRANSSACLLPRTIGDRPGGRGPGQGLSCALTSFPLHSTFDSHRPGEPGLPHPWGMRRGPWLASVPILSRDGDGIPDPPRPVGETLGGGFRAPGESHPQPGAASSLLSPHRLRGGHLSPWPQA